MVSVCTKFFQSRYCVCGCCFNGCTARTNEIILIIANFISIFFLSWCFKSINWDDIYLINLILFIVIIVLIVICIILTILLRCWRSSNEIKTSKREISIKLSKVDLILTILCFVICIIEEIAFIINFFILKSECDPKKKDKAKSIYYRRFLSVKKNEKKEKETNINCAVINNNNYYIIYVTLSYIELILTISMCIISILKRRIINKTDLDGPEIEVDQVVVVPIQQMGISSNIKYNNSPRIFPLSNNIPYDYSSNYANNPHQIKIAVRDKSPSSSNSNNVVKHERPW